MINFFDNDYAVPTIVGDCRESISAAKIIRKKTKLKVTVFAERLSLLNRTKYTFRKLTSDSEQILLLTLTDFAEHQHEYCTPVLIYCKEHNEDFISKHSPMLEHLYVIIPAQEINNYFFKEN